MGSGRSGEHRGGLYCLTNTSVVLTDTAATSSAQQYGIPTQRRQWGMRLTQGVICDEHWKDPSKGWVYIDDVKASIVQNKQTLDG